MVHVDKKIRLVVVGEGPQRKNLEKLAEDLKIDNRIKFTGWIDDKSLIDLYSRSLGVIYVPQDEDYGYVTLEAFASKKPIITTNDSGGVLEFVKDGENGSIVSLDSKAIANSMNKLTIAKAKKMGENGFESIKHLSWDDCIDKLTSFKS